MKYSTIIRALKTKFFVKTKNSVLHHNFASIKGLAVENHMFMSLGYFYPEYSVFAMANYLLRHTYDQCNNKFIEHVILQESAIRKFTVYNENGQRFHKKNGDEICIDYNKLRVLVFKNVTVNDTLRKVIIFLTNAGE